MNEEAVGSVIVFDNLRRRTSVIGQYDKVSVVSKAFVSTDAHGLLRKIKNREEVGLLASQAGARIKEMLTDSGHDA